MSRHFVLVAVLLTLLCHNAVAQKPILPDFEADPSAHVFGDQLWIYPSHDIAGSRGWDMTDWHAFSSTDLRTWKDHGVIFSLADLTWAKESAWAPDAAYRDGKYYFYFPADDQIGVAVSDNPDGPFKDALGKPLIARGESGTRAIDPCIFIDEDGQAYLYFGQNNLRVVKLKADMITRDGEVQSLAAKNYHEGIWVHKRNGIYYLSYPIFDGVNAGKLAYGMGRSPHGPFEYKGVIMDNRSRNIHHSIVQYRGRWYIFYHVQGPSPYERRVCAEFLDYNANGTIKAIAMTAEGVGLPNR